MSPLRRNLLLAALMASALPVIWSPAQAGNSNVEATLQGFGDLSMFYQATLNSGLINELNESSHYTIFAPTNAAFAVLSQQAYPCFYAPQCRPQIATLLRGHIIEGRHDVAQLVTYGQGIPTLNSTIAKIREPYVNQYTVDNRTILSKSEAGGNTIYRIDGILADQQALNAFRVMPYAPQVRYTPPVPLNTVTTRRVITTYDSSIPASPAYPAGGMADPDSSGPRDSSTSETTTVITGYTATTDNVQ